MRLAFLFLLISLCTVVVFGNHDAKKRHNGHDRDQRHHQVKHDIHKKGEDHQRSHDHDKKHHEMKHGVHEKSHGHQRTHGHKERHHGIHEKHPEQIRHGHRHHVAKKSHAGHLDNKRHHDLHHADHDRGLARPHKRVTSENETTTEAAVSIVTKILGDSWPLLDELSSTSTVSDITNTTGDTTDDGEEDPDDDDVDGEDDDKADIVITSTTTRKPSHGILWPLPPILLPPLIPHWIENATKDISDRYNCIRRLVANITTTIRANLRRNPQVARNISLTINDRVVYNVIVQVGVTCPSDDDEDSSLSLGIISQFLHQSSCVGSITRNITCEILRDISSNLTSPQHIVLTIDKQVVYNITLDLSQRLCTKPGSQQRASLLRYLVGFPANVDSAYPIKRSGLNNVAKRIYDRLYNTDGKSEEKS